LRKIRDSKKEREEAAAARRQMLLSPRRRKEEKELQTRAAMQIAVGRERERRARERQELRVRWEEHGLKCESAMALKSDEEMKVREMREEEGKRMEEEGREQERREEERREEKIREIKTMRRAARKGGKQAGRQADVKGVGEGGRGGAGKGDRGRRADERLGRPSESALKSTKDVRDLLPLLPLSNNDKANPEGCGGERQVDTLERDIDIDREIRMGSGNELLSTANAERDRKREKERGGERGREGERESNKMRSKNKEELHAQCVPQLDLASRFCRMGILAQEDIAQAVVRDVDGSAWEEVEEEGEEKGEEEEAEINEKAHGQRETVNNGSGAGEDVGCVRRRRRKRVKTQGERASIDALLRQVVLDYCVCVCGILLLLH
jgi:hypothetical protein